MDASSAFFVLGTASALCAIGRPGLNGIDRVIVIGQTVGREADRRAEGPGGSDVYRDIPPELRAIIEPVLGDHDCELVDVDLRMGQGQGLVRIVVDSDSGDGMVPVDACASISREVESAFDAADAIPGRYRLEVTSPGLDRWLGREKDFSAAVGCEVKIEARRPLDGRRRFRGVLEDFRDGVAKVKLDGPNGRDVSIPFDEVKKANTVYTFSRQDFAGRATD